MACTWSFDGSVGVEVFCVVTDIMLDGVVFIVGGSNWIVWFGRGIVTVVTVGRILDEMVVWTWARARLTLLLAFKILVLINWFKRLVLLKLNPESVSQTLQIFLLLSRLIIRHLFNAWLLFVSVTERDKP